MHRKTPGTWEVHQEGKNWQVFNHNGQLIATLAEGPSFEARARTIAMSPCMLDALKGVAELMGDEDLPDNREFSDGAVSDMVRTAVQLAGGEPI